MKWTMRYAALLAALVLSLGMVSIMRPGVAAADSDEVMLRPPGARGDPDSGGPGYVPKTTWDSLTGYPRRSLSMLSEAVNRRLHGSRPQSVLRPKQTGSRSR